MIMCLGYSPHIKKGKKSIVFSWAVLNSSFINVIIFISIIFEFINKYKKMTIYIVYGPIKFYSGLSSKTNI